MPPSSASCGRGPGEYRHGNAGTGQLIALCEETSGKDLSELFGTWLFGEKKPAQG
ncbi:hypothetical protein [Streptomyces sp. NPDC051776]|uniref:hypothetical protein n=1 Tax=Streptomyces sp. NPDC051776 TaxID=3155414 RepID=UPI0034258B9E